MSQVTIVSSGPLMGEAQLPGDKSISHRALLLAAIAEGTSHISGLSNGDDVERTRLAIEALGAKVTSMPVNGMETNDKVVVVEGGRTRLTEPLGPIDVGNSGTGLRLLAGLASSLPFLTILIGDESIHRRPMGRIVEPLRAMGATIDGRRDGTLAPLVIRGGNLSGINYQLPVPSAQVKGCILIAGLDASGTTTVRETVPTRRHTEEMLAEMGTEPILQVDASGTCVTVKRSTLSPFDFAVPGDPSQAAFLAVAATIVRDSDIVIKNVYLGPGRAGFLSVLLRMGANIELENQVGNAADLHVRFAQLIGTDVSGQELTDCIDEVPVLAIAAAFANGTTRFIDATELRAKESDRIETMLCELAAIGALGEAVGDTLVINGNGMVPSRLGGSTTVRSHGDHRVAMALVVAQLAASVGGASEMAIDDFDAVGTSWPGFLDVIGSLQR